MSRQRQQGVTLIVSLIMLILLTIMALNSFNIGKSSLQVIDNAQQQAQVVNAAEAIMNQVVSTPTFTEAPESVLDNSNCPSSVSAPANSRCVDLYGDNKTVIVVAMSPQPVCRQATAVPASELNLTTAQSPGWGCVVGDPQAHGVEGAVTGDSLCADSLWEVTASATEPVSQARAVLTRGVSMRVSKDSVDTSCPL